MMNVFGQTQKTDIISVQDPESKWAGFRKIVLFLLGIAAAAATGACIDYSFRNDLRLFWVFAAVSVVWGCLYLITGFVTSWSVAVLLAVVEGFGICAPIILRMGGFVSLLVWFGCAGVMIVGYALGASRMHNVVHLRVQDVFSAAKNSVLIFMCILCAFVFGMAKTSHEGFFIQKTDVQAVLAASDPVVRIMYPNYRSDASIESVIDSIVQQQKLPGMSELQNLVPSNLPQGVSAQLSNANDLIVRAQREMRASLLGQVGGWFGMKLTGKETITDIVYAWLLGAYQKLPQETRVMLKDALIGLAFVLLYTTFKVFGFLFDIVFGVIYWALRGMRIVRVGTVTVEKETLMI